MKKNGGTTNAKGGAVPPLGTPTPPRRLATVKEACHYAKLGRTRLYEKINANVIRAYRREGRTLIDLDSIDAMNAKTLKPWKRSKLFDFVRR